MCPPHYEYDSKAELRAKAAFRRGALSWLAACDRVLVLATFVEPLVWPTSSYLDTGLFQRKRGYKKTVAALALVWYTAKPHKLHVEKTSDQFRQTLTAFLKHPLEDWL
eukprot:3672463-Amphidinium_carterae.1